MKYPILLGFLAICSLLDAQSVRLDSSNLPICIIDTRGKTIANEPKIVAHMAILYNGPGKMNYVRDRQYNYNNFIGIEIRGNSSQSFPQKQYGIELRDSVTGNDLDASLMDMPAEEDWVLYAPYNDISMLRNVMTYHLWNGMGHWGPRTRFCELILNNEYQGIYILMESIKRGPNRVDIANLKKEDTSGIELTGGYIMKIDKKNNPSDKSFISKVKSTTGQNISWLYHYPESDDIHPKQEAYIHNYIDTVEQLIASANFADPVNGYTKYLSTPSFIDYFILTELSRNADAYKASSFFYKEKRELDGGKGKFKAGPVWDYNFAFGNSSFCSGAMFTGWMYDGCTPATLPTPILWRRLLADPAYLNEVKCRYLELRKTILDTTYLFAYLNRYAFDTLDAAQKRHFTKWRILGTNPGGFNAYIASSYPDEMNRLKTWIRNRLNWLDANLQGTCILPQAKLKSPLDPACFSGVRPSVPNAQPFNIQPYDYEGKESVSNMPSNIIRWLLVELREANDSTKVVDRRAVLLRNDSVIVDTNFMSNITFYRARANEDYYIVLRYDLGGLILSKNKIKLPNNVTVNLNLHQLRIAPAPNSPLYYDYNAFGIDTLNICFGSRIILSDSNLVKLGYSGLDLTSDHADVRFVKLNELEYEALVPQTGIYTLNIFRSCSNEFGLRTTIHLNVLPLPEPQIIGPDKFCPGDSIQLTTSGFQKYLWSNGSDQQQTSVSLPGNYSLTVTDQNGCTASVAKDVQLYPEIQGTINTVSNHVPDSCLVSFIPMDPIANYMYQWSTGSTTREIVIPRSIVDLIVTDANGCRKSYSVSCLPVSTDGQNLAAELTVYPNPNSGSFKIQCKHPVKETVLWSLDGTLELRTALDQFPSFDSPNSWSQLPAGMYYLMVQTSTGKIFKTKVILQPN